MHVVQILKYLNFQTLFFYKAICLLEQKKIDSKLIQNAQTQGILYVLMISMIKTSTQSNILVQ